MWQIGASLGAEVSLADFRKDMILDFYNEAGQLAISYKIYRAWVSEYQALPDLDANANAVAIQHIMLENEGWERDTSVTEPTEPSFTFHAGIGADTIGRRRAAHESGRLRRFFSSGILAKRMEPRSQLLSRRMTLTVGHCNRRCPGARTDVRAARRTDIEGVGTWPRTSRTLARACAAGIGHAGAGHREPCMLPLAERNALLLGLRAFTFGPQLEGFAVCPECGEAAGICSECGRPGSVTARFGRGGMAGA